MRSATAARAAASMAGRIVVMAGILRAEPGHLQAGQRARARVSLAEEAEQRLARRLGEPTRVGPRCAGARFRAPMAGTTADQLDVVATRMVRIVDPDPEPRGVLVVRVGEHLVVRREEPGRPACDPDEADDRSATRRRCRRGSAATRRGPRRSGRAPGRGARRGRGAGRAGTPGGPSSGPGRSPSRATGPGVGRSPGSEGSRSPAARRRPGSRSRPRTGPGPWPPCRRTGRRTHRRPRGCAGRTDRT